MFDKTDPLFDRLKIKFTDGQSHILEIDQSHDLDWVKPLIPELIEQAKQALQIDESVDVAFVRGLRVDQDEMEE